MSELIFREKVLPQDRDNVGRILAHTRFFTPEEQEIGISLVDEHLLKGESCGYLFLFAQEHETTLGYACYGPIPGTVNGYDLYWIAVAPHHQKKGLGGTLEEKMCSALLEQSDSAVIRVETAGRDDYLGQRYFYLARHYGECGRIPDFYSEGDDLVLYCKKLTKKR